MVTFLAVFFGIITASLLTLYGAFSWGYVASVIYSWFLVPTFDNLPPIEWWQFAGMMYLVNCFVHSDLHFFKDEVKNKDWGSVVAVLQPWMLLFGAWIFKILIFN